MTVRPRWFTYRPPNLTQPTNPKLEEHVPQGQGGWNMLGGVGWVRSGRRVRLEMISQTVIRQTVSRRINHKSNRRSLIFSIDKASCKRIDPFFLKIEGRTRLKSSAGLGLDDKLHRVRPRREKCILENVFGKKAFEKTCLERDVTVKLSL